MKDKIQQAKDYLHQISDDIINAQNIYIQVMKPSMEF